MITIYDIKVVNTHLAGSSQEINLLGKVGYKFEGFNDEGLALFQRKRHVRDDCLEAQVYFNDIAKEKSSDSKTNQPQETS